jgi:parvulin-like peptidyl-prolyl isomerase
LLRREIGFMAAASEYSEDEESAKNGGHCEIIKGTHDKKFDKIIFGLDVKQSSRVFKSKEGYNIIVLLEKTKTKAKIMRILIKYKH